jgi:hypothetical protein
MHCLKTYFVFLLLLEDNSCLEQFSTIEEYSCIIYSSVLIEATWASIFIYLSFYIKHILVHGSCYSSRTNTFFVNQG